MTKDYKPAPTSQKSAGKDHGLMKGLLIGVILGIVISLGVALFIKGGDSPFVAKVSPAPDIVTGTPAPDAAAKPQAVPNDAAAAKPRFDFYTILPGNEAPVTEQEAQQSITGQGSANQGEPTKNYYLQVGAFQNETDADNLKARLALLGLEAVVQTANLPDKGVSHRVRVGPLTDIEQIRKTRSELARNGFDAFLIQQNSAAPDNP